MGCLGLAVSRAFQQLRCPCSYSTRELQCTVSSSFQTPLLLAGVRDFLECSGPELGTDTSGTFQNISRAIYPVRTPFPDPEHQNTQPGLVFPICQSYRRKLAGCRLVGCDTCTTALLVPMVSEPVARPSRGMSRGSSAHQVEAGRDILSDHGPIAADGVRDSCL